MFLSRVCSYYNMMSDIKFHQKNVEYYKMTMTDSNRYLVIFMWFTF